jgi:hypothetical protein
MYKTYLLALFIYGGVFLSLGFERKHLLRVGKRIRTFEEFVANRKHHDHNRRRRLDGAEEVTHVETGIGTHYAYVWVGTPAQRQTVILDTGSFHTAFPCDPCTSCGDYLDYHESGPFEPDDSSTFVMQTDNWSASYAEGDGWTAHVSDDYFFLGGTTLEEIPLASQLSFFFQFGCMFQIGGLFITQYADGIMGMGMDTSTIVPKLVANGLLDRRSFGMCFAVDGGTLALGGSNQHLHNQEMEYSYLKKLVDKKKKNSAPHNSICIYVEIKKKKKDLKTGTIYFLHLYLVFIA